MYFLLLLIMIGVCVVVGIAAYGMGRNTSERRNGLNKLERAEFRDTELLIDDLMNDAITAETLGESYGAIARDKIHTFRKAHK